MKDKDLLDLLRRLNTAADVESLIESEDLEWRPLGGRENIGTVRSGSGPAQALTERLTNAVDAIVERAVYEDEFDEEPTSPREAVTKLFGLSEMGYNDMSQSWVRDVAQTNLRLQIHESGTQSRPVIEIQDAGIGQPPSNFENTFLSLNQDNKISKPYLIGKYGQGGSNTFEYCEYAIIISRHTDGGDIGWSIVRYNDRTDIEGETYTDGIFEYCVRPDESIPSIDEEHAKGWTGSTVRLVEYDATNFKNIVGPGAKNLYTVVHETMFGSIFPVSLEDHRIERFSSYNGKPRKRTVVGSRYRLDKPAKDVDKAREFYRIDLGEYGTLRVKYWVLEKTGSVNQFVDKARPIVFTHHGQKHHVEPKRFFKRTNHTFLKDRIIIEVNGDELSTKGKRIFSATRDRASEGDAYRKVTTSLLESLKEDQLLIDLNQKYKQKALQESSSEQEERAKTLLADLLQEPDPSETGDAVADGGSGSGGSGGGSGGKNSSRDPVEPRYESPTFIEIDNAADPLKAKQGKTMRVRLKIDVQDDFEKLERGEIRIELSNSADEFLSYRNETALDEGWKTFQFEVDEDAELETEGKLTAVVEWDDGRFEDTRWVEVVEPPKQTGGQKKSVLEAPEIRQVTADKAETRSTLGWEDTEDAVVEFVPDSDGPGDVFVAMFNEGIQPIRETNDNENIIESRDTQYAAYMAYYELMRYRSVEDGETVEPDEEYLHKEKNRVARMLMRSISEGMSPEALGIV